MKFVQLANSLKEGLAPFYLIEGEEAYFRDHAVSAIRAACALAQPMLNDVRIDGETLKGDLVSFRDNLYTLPFFDERRLVRVYEYYPSEREWENVLKSYAENPCPSTVLVVVNAGKKANAADLKRKKGVTFVDCSREEEEMLSRWLYALMRRQGLDVDADAAGLMVQYCARDAARMKTETERLRLLLGEGGRITRGVVEENVAKDAEYKIYELTQAASRKNATAFWEILTDLSQKGLDENAILASLVSHFRILTETANWKGTEAEAAKLLGVKPYAVKKNRELALRLGKERVETLYTSLYALSCDMKSGKNNKTNAMSAAIAEIFFG